MLDSDVRNADALRGLGELKLIAGDAASAAELFGRYVEASGDPRARAEIDLKLAVVYAEQLDDTTGAIAALDRVLEVHPEDLSARERLVDLALKKDDPRRAADELAEL